MMTIELQPYSIHELGQRQNQEDSLFPEFEKSTANDRLFILCDGMGGHEKGEVASATVCETMSQTILSSWNPDEPLSDDLLQQAIEAAYNALDAKDNGEAKKMGTTMTFLCFHSEGATVAHIGDSRVYQLRPAKGDEPASIIFRTRDHSLVNDLIRIGEITEEEAKHHPQKNVITRAMQPCQERRSKADIAHITDIQAGDYFYMCSDGMLEETTDENLLYIITKQDATDQQKVDMLINVTAENKDNHTAHLIHICNVHQDNHGDVKPEPVQEGIRVELEEDDKEPCVKKHWYQNRITIILAAVVLAALAIGSAVISFFSLPENEDKSASIDTTTIHQKHSVETPDVSDANEEELGAVSEVDNADNMTEEQ